MVGVAGVIYRSLEKVLGVVVVVWRNCLGLFGGFVEAVWRKWLGWFVEAFWRK